MPTDAAEEIREAVYARIVDSLTDKHYYRRWAEEVERINRQYETRIRELLAVAGQSRIHHLAPSVRL